MRQARSGGDLHRGTACPRPPAAAARSPSTISTAGPEDEIALGQHCCFRRAAPGSPYAGVDVSRRRLPAESCSAAAGPCRCRHRPDAGLSDVAGHGTDLAIAHAAAEAGVPYILSTVATTDIETIARALDGVFWFQLYMPGRREIGHDLVVRRARDAGAGALFVTLDVAAPGARAHRTRSARAPSPCPSA